MTSTFHRLLVTSVDVFIPIENKVWNFQLKGAKSFSKFTQPEISVNRNVLRSEDTKIWLQNEVSRTISRNANDTSLSLSLSLSLFL